MSAVLRITLAILCIFWATAPARAQFVEATTTIHTWAGEVAGDGFGTVRALGDLNGDGVVDLGVGAAANESNGVGAGKAYIYDGATGDTLRTHVKPSANRFGYDLSGIGDVDGDDVPDYVISAPRTLNFLNFTGSRVGRAFVYSGATGTQIQALLGTTYGAGAQRGFGSFVAGCGNFIEGGAGDVDNDGTPDFLVGANIYNGTSGFNGGAFVISGADLSTVIWTLEGEAQADLFGFGGGGVGDLDNDGHADFVIGAPDAGPGNRGRAYVYSGQSGLQFPWSPLEPDTTGGRFGLFFARGPGDLNGDGTPDILVGDFLDGTLGASTGKVYAFSGVDGSELYSLTGTHAGQGFGVARGCGDVDFDGNADFLVGAFGDSSAATGGGRLTIHSGLDGSTLRTITGNIAGDAFGIGAFGVGDVDGDFALDFAVASTGNDDAGLNAGRVYVLAGDILPPVAAPLGSGVIGGFSLLRPRPNPAAGDTEIAFEAPAAAHVRLAIYDVQGRRVRVLREGPVSAGVHRLRWDGRARSGSAVAPGVYFVRLSVPGFEATESVVRIR